MAPNGKPIVPVSVAELIDKITILKIKKKNIKDIDKLNNIENELNELLSVKEIYVQKSIMIDDLETQLMVVNQRIWDIEDEIRELERSQKFDDRFISVARSVYRTNDMRAEIKKKINILTNSVLIEEKSYSKY